MVVCGVAVQAYDEERNPRVLVDAQGQRILYPSEGGYSNNAACVGGGTFSYGALAWRFMEKDFRMRSTYGAVAGSTLEDWPSVTPTSSPTTRRPSVRCVITA